MPLISWQANFKPFSNRITVWLSRIITTSEWPFIFRVRQIHYEFTHQQIYCKPSISCHRLNLKLFEYHISPSAFELTFKIHEINQKCFSYELLQNLTIIPFCFSYNYEIMVRINLNFLVGRIEWNVVIHRTDSPLNQNCCAQFTWNLFKAPSSVSHSNCEHSFQKFHHINRLHKDWSELIDESTT